MPAAKLAECQIGITLAVLNNTINTSSGWVYRGAPTTNVLGASKISADDFGA